MKRFVIITVCLLVLLHAFVAWIHMSYPEPDSSPTIRLWQQGYVEAGPASLALAGHRAEDFSPVVSILGIERPWRGPSAIWCQWLFVSSAAWFAFVLGVYSLIRFIRRRQYDKVEA